MLTTAQIDAKIAELEAARDELILLPVSGTVGRTVVNLAGKMEQIEGRLAELYAQRKASLNGGRSVRPRRCC